MTQVLHLLKKDIRHQRIDLALYTILLISVGCLIPSGWTGHWTSNEMLPFLSGLAQIALPVSWLVLITRLVHAEPLVGDRQFWTTRPYRWSSLLLSKLLFLLVCIALPYLMMQCLVAAYGGVSSLNRGLLVDGAMHVLIVWIPMFLLAAVTATLATTFFTTLVSVILWVAVLTLLVGAQGPVADAPFARPILATIFAVIFVMVLVRLYKQRRILEGRLLLGASAFVFLILIFLISKMSQASLGTVLLQSRYRINPSGFRLRYDPSIPHTAKGEGSAISGTLLCRFSLLAFQRATGWTEQRYSTVLTLPSFTISPLGAPSR